MTFEEQLARLWVENYVDGGKCGLCSGTMAVKMPSRGGAWCICPNARIKRAAMDAER